MMKRTTRTVIILSIVLCPTGLFGADLIDALRLAETNDPQFGQVLATHRAVLETLPQAEALLYPSINFLASSRLNDQDISNTGFGASGNIEFNSHGYRLNLTQPIFRLDRLVTLKQSEIQIQQSAISLESARQDLILRVAERYFDALRAQDNIEFSEAEKNSLKHKLEQAEQRFEVGLIAITDVQEAKAGYDRSTAGKVLAENQLDSANEAMGEITGEYLESYAKLTENMPLLGPDPEQIEQWTSRSLEENPDILAARQETEVARQEIRKQKAGHYPTLDLTVQRSYDDSGGRFGGNQVHATTVGVDLAVPIFQGGLVNSRTRQAYENYEVSMLKLKQIQRAVQRQTREAYFGVLLGISQVMALKQALLSSEIALQATEAGFEVGTRTAVDVVASERATLQARKDYSNARYNYLIDTLKLKRAVGNLSIEDIEVVNSWLK